MCFDEISSDELVAYNDYLEMQALIDHETIEHMAEFARWIDTNRPTAEELDAWCNAESLS